MLLPSIDIFYRRILFKIRSSIYESNFDNVETLSDVFSYGLDRHNYLKYVVDEK